MNALNSYWMRKTILAQAMRAGVGHIGSSLSVVEILVALFKSNYKHHQQDENDRDRFILSKGHASLALYSALFLKDILSQEELETYGCDGTLLGVHPEHALSAVDFCTGSLGQGISYAAGAALAAKLQKSSRRVYALISDGECNEGSVWEAMMFAGQHQLSNLVVVVDYNQQQALDFTANIIKIDRFIDHWRLFGWDAHEVDGHDVSKISETLAMMRHVEQPHVIIARTTFGKGVSFMENQIKWHYLPMTDEQYQAALAELEQTCEPQ